jgi:hypothetical protein
VVFAVAVLAALLVSGPAARARADARRDSDGGARAVEGKAEAHLVQASEPGYYWTTGPEQLVQAAPHGSQVPLATGEVAKAAASGVRRTLDNPPSFTKIQLATRSTGHADDGQLDEAALQKASSNPSPHQPGTRHLDEETRQNISLLMYNPHAECFIRRYDRHYPQCRQNVQFLTNGILTGDEGVDRNFNAMIDFANMVYTMDKYDPPAGWGAIETQCPKPPARSSGDSSLLLYREDRWKTVGQPWRDCLSKDRQRRPYTGQVFGEKGTDMKVVVIAAHFPHPGEFTQTKWKLQKAIQRLTQHAGTSKVILIADTNMDKSFSGQSILQNLGVPHYDQASTTWLHHSCCLPRFNYVGYDRVLTNFGKSGDVMETHTPLDKDKVKQWGARNMHLPVIGILHY